MSSLEELQLLAGAVLHTDGKGGDLIASKIVVSTM